ncbi:hypothetical protein HLB44_18650 [Aquincola sp. S2]|uniref:DUF3313 domain-containing protein n=1 Tax=Pseudaquabacterium terrae TaxID=2732868 RepID=A0ABX2EK44_9BURK|nr:hypothetical protein [Aquabacterium terrae]NRF69017.1 hypothetical protein [Aquabacterium terrae]
MVGRHRCKGGEIVSPPAVAAHRRFVGGRAIVQREQSHRTDGVAVALIERSLAMRLWRWLAAVAGTWALGGCVSIVPVDLHKGAAIFDEKTSVGVVVQLPERPNVWEYDPERGGAAGGLLQLGIVTAVTSKLTAHAKSLPTDELRAVESELMRALQKKGVAARSFSDSELMKTFKPDRFDAKDGTSHVRDMRPLRDRLGVERLLVVTVGQVGFNYPFSGVIPMAAGDPMAYVGGEAYLLDLRTNAYQWYKKVRTLRGVGKTWDQPPAYPALTAKFFEAVEVAKEEIVADLAR